MKNHQWGTESRAHPVFNMCGQSLSAGLYSYGAEAAEDAEAAAADCCLRPFRDSPPPPLSSSSSPADILEGRTAAERRMAASIRFLAILRSLLLLLCLPNMIKAEISITLG